MIRIAFPLACGLAWVLIAAGAHAQSLDQVTPNSGAPISGTVVDMTPDNVVIEVRGQQRSVPVNDLKRVAFADDPPELKRARDAVLTGNYESAFDDLKAINAANIQRDFVKQDYEFYVAYTKGKLALSGGGDKGAAAQAMLKFVGTSRASFHIYDAAELLGDLAVALESYDGAVRYYGVVARAPFPEYQLKGGVLEGRALMAQDKFAEAVGKFDAVIAGAIDTPAATRQKRMAEVGKAACLAETGQPDQAVATLEKIIAENDASDMELFGRAYNALGRSHLKANRNKEALLAYLHTDILFYGTPEVHAEALYHLSDLWKEANKADRAVAARNLLTQRYAGSVWAKKP